jgi:hypothetical protein
VKPASNPGVGDEVAARGRRPAHGRDLERRVGPPAVFVVVHAQVVRARGQELRRGVARRGLVAPAVDQELPVHPQPHAVVGRGRELEISAGAGGDGAAEADAEVVHPRAVAGPSAAPVEGEAAPAHGVVALLDSASGQRLVVEDLELPAIGRGGERARHTAPRDRDAPGLGLAEPLDPSWTIRTERAAAPEAGSATLSWKS